VGHANRPRLHDALGLDAQSRCIRFPTGRRWESNPDAYGYAHSNSDSYAHGNSYGYAYGNAHSNSYTDADFNTDSEAYIDAKTSTDAAASPIVCSGSDKWLVTSL
jgi:hypothetical protein